MTSPRRLFLNPDWWLGIALTVLGIALHLFFLTRAGGLWRDEVNLVNLAQTGSLQGMTQDTFPVLMPLLLNFWSGAGLGGSDLGLRALGCLIGLSLLGAFWWSAWRMHRAVPAAGLLLLGLNTTVIIYGDSLRAYGLGSVWIVVAVGSLWTFLERPTAWRGIGTAVAFVLSVQALFQNSVLVAALCVGAWAVCWRKSNWRVALCVLGMGGLAALSLIPYVPGLLAGGDAANVLRGGTSRAQVTAAVARTFGSPVGAMTYFWVAFSLLALVRAVLALRKPADDSEAAALETNRWDVSLYSGTTLATAILGFAAFQWISNLSMRSWYFIPPLAVAATCFGPLRLELPRTLRLAVCSAVAGLVLVCGMYATADLNFCFTNVNVLAMKVKTSAAQGDFVVVTPWYCGISFQRYFEGPCAWSTLPPLADHRLHRYDLLREALKTSHAINPVLAQAEAALRSGHRVWVVGQMEPRLRGLPAPAVLAPAPLPDSGWSDKPFIRNWSDRLSHFLATHAESVNRVTPSSDSLVHPNENLELFVATGWTQ